MSTTVASANILFELPAAQAVDALEDVLAGRPELVALQEWYVRRLGILRRTGDVRFGTVSPLPMLPLPAAGSHDYHWVTTLDGNVVGARSDRFDRVSSQAFLNIWPAAPSERPERPLRTEPPRFIATGVFRDREVDRTVALLSYHLSSGVLSGSGGYREDRPRLSARHRTETAHLEAHVAHLQAAGHVVYAAGDANFDPFALRGLTSAWLGREDEPGTIGENKIDDVFGPGPATEVRRVVTASDHEAILVTRPD